MHTAENLAPASGGGAAPSTGGDDKAGFVGEMFQSLCGNVTTAMLNLNTALQEVSYSIAVTFLKNLNGI